MSCFARGRELAGVLVAGAAGAAPERVAALGHEAGDHAVEDDVVVEAELRQVDGARDVHRRHVGKQLDRDRRPRWSSGSRSRCLPRRTRPGAASGARSSSSARVLVDLLLGDERVDCGDGHVFSLCVRFAEVAGASAWESPWSAAPAVRPSDAVEIATTAANAWRGQRSDHLAGPPLCRSSGSLRCAIGVRRGVPGPAVGAA